MEENIKMRITKFQTFIVPPRWLFLKISTDEGIDGWGEPIVEGRANTVKAAVEELSEYLIGKDPLKIEDHWTVLCCSLKYIALLSLLLVRSIFYHG